MPRAVSLYMPYWSTDLIQRRNRSSGSAGRPEPVLLYTESAGRQLVARRCARATAAGVRPEMTVAHARALLPAGQVTVEPHQPRRELVQLGALGRWALRFSPIVAVDSPDGLLVDIAGCQRLFGGEDRLVDRIAGAVEGLGFQVRVEAAPTFACAWAMARYGPGPLEALPVEALRVDRASVEGLREVGIERIGHLLAMQRSSLAARFGHGLLRRLDQATGKTPEMIDPVRPAAPPVVERFFTGPVTQLEAITLTVRELLVELADVLGQRESGARRLELRFDRLDAEPLSVAVVLSRPSRDVSHLWSLLAPRLESINLGWGVERLRLAASRPGKLTHEDEQWPWAGGETVDAKRLDRDLGELLDILSNRLGPDRVTRVEPIESHLPERTFRLHPALEEKTPGVF
ncbi:MAG: Y-family DNA polymerase, partial [Planctomycetota bacterium]